jgi:hypothetical protein
MIIDGIAYRFPEDSVRMLRAGKRLRPSEIENVEVIPGIAAAQRYHTDGRPVIRITTRRARRGLGRNRHDGYQSFENARP